MIVDVPDNTPLLGDSSQIPSYSGGTTIQSPTPLPMPAIKQTPSINTDSQVSTGFNSLQDVDSKYNTEVSNINAHYDKYITDPTVDSETKKEALRQKNEKLAQAKELHSQWTNQYQEKLKIGDTSKPSELKGEMADTVSKLLERDTKPITGAMQIGPLIPGNKAQYTAALYDKLKGLLSLDNVKLLKGQGQVSDAERRLLEDASSALNRKLSDEDFRSILTELQTKLSPKAKEALFNQQQEISTLPSMPQKMDISQKLQNAKNIMQNEPKTISGDGGVLGSIAQGLMPDVVSYAQKNLQKIGQGNVTPTAMTLPEIAASTAGPLGEFVAGSESQKEKTKAAAELANTVNITKGIAGAAQGGLNLLGAAGRAKSINPTTINSLLRKEAVQRFKDTGGSIDAIKSEIKDSIKNYIETINPSKAATQQGIEMMKAIDNNNSIDGLLKLVTGWQRRGYGIQGPKSTEIPVMLQEGASMARQAIAKQAPEVAKYTRDIASSIDLMKSGGKIIGKGLANAIPLGVVAKVLGVKLGQ